jgi:hypothetical protein
VVVLDVVELEVVVVEEEELVVVVDDEVVVVVVVVSICARAVIGTNDAIKIFK